MPETDCQTACAEAYTAQVDHSADVLRDKLVMEKTDDDKHLAQT